MENTKRAPVTATADTLIRAPVATVWSVLTTIAEWPTWNHEITKAEITGPIEPGTEFRWKAGRLSIVSVLTAVEDQRRLAWRGKSFAIRAFHEWTLDVRDEGVLVQTSESFEGILPRLLKQSMKKMLKSTLNRGVTLLKEECERRAGERKVST